MITENILNSYQISNGSQQSLKPILFPRNMLSHSLEGIFHMFLQSQTSFSSQTPHLNIAFHFLKKIRSNLIVANALVHCPGLTIPCTAPEAIPPDAACLDVEGLPQKPTDDCSWVLELLCPYSQKCLGIHLLFPSLKTHVAKYNRYGVTGSLLLCLKNGEL